MSEGGTKERSNNINIVRIVAALMVMSGHMAFIDGSYDIPLLMGRNTIQTLGVKIFFLLGGYLITKSWLSDSSIIRYFIKRFFRIFPPLIVCVTSMAFLFGPLISNLRCQEYFANGGAIIYLRNILLFPVYSLPGVFINNPYSNVVNGSLWTLPIEVSMYCAVPIILTCSSFRRKGKNSKRILFAISLLVCTVELIHKACYPELRVVIYGTDIAQAMDIVPYYFIGMCYANIDMAKYISIEKSVLLTMLYACLSKSLPFALNELFLYIVFPYFIFSFAFCGRNIMGGLNIKHEISYGIYLYGFFVQQMVISVCIQFGFSINRLICLLISIGITVIFALVSEMIIEKPSQVICKKILARIAHIEKRR